jgi:hypothetical protein
MRIRILRGLCALLLAALVDTGASPAQAHDPYVEDPQNEWGSIDAPWTAPQATRSYALYGRLDPYGDVDAFAYQFTEAVANFPVEVLIPVCGAHFELFFPTIAVIGPGLPAPDDSVAKTLPFALSDGAGLVVFSEPERANPREAYLNVHAGNVYRQTLFTLNVPQAGAFTVAVWEPDGHIGAYILATGRLEEFPGDRGDERRAALTAIRSGAWMRQDCAAPVAITSCPATPSDALGPFYKPDAPVRSKIGTGYVLTGTVRDTTTCLPVTGAQIEAWQVNEQAEYSDDKRATLFSNKQGGYRLDSNRPLPYAGRPPHIHMRVSAPGYQPLVTQHYPVDGESAAEFALNLQPN